MFAVSGSCLLSLLAVSVATFHIYITVCCLSIKVITAPHERDSIMYILYTSYQVQGATLYMKDFKSNCMHRYDYSTHNRGSSSLDYLETKSL